MTNMNMRANVTGNFPGRTYRFYNGKSLYEFGHGLSYSTFSKFIISAPSTLLVQLNSACNPQSILSIDSMGQNTYTNGQAIDVTSINCTNLRFGLVISVKNNGPISGDHVVLVFWKPPSSANVTGAPNMQLVGFDRVEVEKGKKHNVTLIVDVCKELSLVDSEGKRKLIMGQHKFIIGSSGERQVRHYLNVRLTQKGSIGSSISM